MKDIKKKLEEIHASLSKTEHVDPELKEKLEVLDNDIKQLLEKEERDSFAYAPLEDAARFLAVKFTNNYPKSALLIGQLADILGKIGI